MTETPSDAGQAGKGRDAPLRTYDRDELSVVWDAARCLHVAKCIQALPQVFDPDARPWVAVDAADADQVAAAVRACPTGALRYQAHAPFAAELPQEPATVTVAANGPLHVRGRITLTFPDGHEREETRVSLCRCGKTGNAPFCDNSHKAVGFQGGPLTEKPSEPLLPGPVAVSWSEPGPYGVKGPASVVAPSGAVLKDGQSCFLCRCGRSGSKPFCDGSHSKP